LKKLVKFGSANKNGQKMHWLVLRIAQLRPQTLTTAARLGLSFPYWFFAGVSLRCQQGKEAFAGEALRWLA